MKFACSVLAAGALLGAAVLSHAAMAQGDFYAGKTVNIIVGFSPGSVLDLYPRLLAPYLSRTIPGNPAVLIQNMPGAGSLTAVLSLDTSAPKDGTTIVVFNPGLLLTSLLRPDKFKVDFNQFSWLGSIAQTLRVCYMWGATGVKTLQEMQKRDQVVMGDTADMGVSYMHQKMLQRIFDVKIKQVLGYPGVADKKLAIERGELDGDCTSWDQPLRDWLRDNKINVIFRLQKGVPLGLPASVPYLGDLVSDPQKRQLLDLLSAPAELGIPMILSKAVPADRLEILRDAFDSALKDPKFLADAEKQQMEISPIRGVDVEEMLKALHETPPAVFAAAKDIMGQ